VRRRPLFRRVCNYQTSSKERMGNIFGPLSVSLFTPAGVLAKKQDQVCLTTLSLNSETSVYFGECASDGTYQVALGQEALGYFNGCPAHVVLTTTRLPPYPAAPACAPSTGPPSASIAPCINDITGVCSAIPVPLSNAALTAIVTAVVVLLIGTILTVTLSAIYRHSDSTSAPIA
jgi:hypothetical protein